MHLIFYVSIVCLFSLFIYLFIFVCFFTYLYIYLFIRLFIISSIYLFILFICLFMCSFISLFFLHSSSIIPSFSSFSLIRSFPHKFQFDLICNNNNITYSSYCKSYRGKLKIMREKRRAAYLM